VQRPKLNKKNEAGDQHWLRAKRTQVHGATSRLQISDENLVRRSTLGSGRERELDPESGARRKNNTEQIGGGRKVETWVARFELLHGDWEPSRAPARKENQASRKSTESSSERPDLPVTKSERETRTWHTRCRELPS
jgi:hypothetical protein